MEEIPDTPDEFVADTADEEESGDDFDAGYSESTGRLKRFFKERLIAWAVGLFSPPGTGPLFGSGAAMLQWQFRDESSDRDD